MYTSSLLLVFMLTWVCVKLTVWFSLNSLTFSSCSSGVYVVIVFIFILVSTVVFLLFRVIFLWLVRVLCFRFVDVSFLISSL